MDLELSDRRVLVTGGSRGIGRAIAKAFLDEGAEVTICARDESGLAIAATELSEFDRLHHRPADMGIAGEPTALVEWAVDIMGGIDVLVSNVSAMAGPDWETSVAVDLAGNNELIRSALGHMEDNTGANIVCIGSRAGVRGTMEQDPAVRPVGVAVRLAHSGVDQPGWFASDSTAASRSSMVGRL